MMLPARMTSRTASGASRGGRATPLASAVALVALRFFAFGSDDAPVFVSVAGPVGLGRLVSSAEAVPALSGRASTAADVVLPALGWTSFGRALGSGAIPVS